MTANNLPGFIIIGGMKCGTTSLFQYLSKHPELSACSVKEPSFFSKNNWHRGLAWYESLFTQDEQIKFEASTNYTKYPNFDQVPERMARTIPNARFIYLVRHPVSRVRSELIHNIRAGSLRYDRISDPGFWKRDMEFTIGCSKYYWQLQQYLEYFDRDRFYILSLEELIADTVTSLNRILGFLGVQDNFYQESMDFHSYNTASRRSLRSFWKNLRIPKQISSIQLTHDQQQQIWDTCADDLSRLESFIGRSLHYSAPRKIIEA